MAAPAGRPTAPLNGTYGSELCDGAASSVVLSWSPVRFAPLGPIGREVSVNAHVEDVQMHSPLIGSQKGVEQLDATEGRKNGQKQCMRGVTEGTYCGHGAQPRRSTARGWG